MRNFILAALPAILILASCGQESVLQVGSDGTEFKVHTNTGAPKVQPGEFVYYHAQRRKGEEVESRSRDLGPAQVFQIPAEKNPGSQTALLEDVLGAMGKGDSATIFLSLDTIPVEKRPAGFENEAMMFFDLVVVDVKSEADFMAEQETKRVEMEAAAAIVQEQAPAILAGTKATATSYAAGDLADQIQRTASGLGYMVIEEGTGPTPTPGQAVSVQYAGALTDGNIFDNSVERGMPIEFPLGVGRVIPGWDEGLGLLKEGSKAYLFIPSSLGYGEAGSPPAIPGNSELVFYVDLVKAQ